MLSDRPNILTQTHLGKTPLSEKKLGEKRDREGSKGVWRQEMEGGGCGGRHRAGVWFLPTRSGHPPGDPAPTQPSRAHLPSTLSSHPGHSSCFIYNNNQFLNISVFGGDKSQLRHTGSFPDQRSNPGPPLWEHGVVATGPPGKSPSYSEFLILRNSPVFSAEESTDFSGFGSEREGVCPSFTTASFAGQQSDPALLSTSSESSEKPTDKTLSSSDIPGG